MITSKTPPELPFSGERFTPECVREMAYEHWHRYCLASTVVGGRRVLDAACGEGYGSALLAGYAKSVDGVDLSDQAVAHARSKYIGDNLRFLSASVTNIPVVDASYDAVVSFETLEHLAQQTEMLTEFRRVLDSTGFLMISSPDKATYSDAAGYTNEFHVKELYRDELMVLLKQHFPAVKLMGQAMAFQSLLWDLDSNGQEAMANHQSLRLDNTDLKVGPTPDLEPLYFVALCAAKQEYLPTLPAISSFADGEQSVYAHYQHEIRKNMAAGGLLKERDEEIHRLKAELAQQQATREDDGI